MNYANTTTIYKLYLLDRVNPHAAYQTVSAFVGSMAFYCCYYKRKILNLVAVIGYRLNLYPLRNCECIMANTYEAIATVEVGSGGAADIEFTSIPGTYTDLAIKRSL
jgi:hypothetical protein